MPDFVRVRFAPSPTGYMHVGGARTALFNYLFARHHGGTFVLRIEDTDRNRFQADAEKEIFSSLKWLGLDWDEGPDCNGSYGPYVQSQRVELYRKYAEELVEAGFAYRCFCSPERLDQMRRSQDQARISGGYDRKCRALSQVEVERNLAKNFPHVIRLKVPDDRTVVFTDEIRGEIATRSDLLDDQVLMKSDAYPTYHLANVVDDHLMGITHILRGDEWISSTPRHVLLYEAFGWRPPIFAHLPVILAPGGGKLSKRHGAASVLDYRKGGVLPEALVNFLALLGWAPGNDRELMNIQEMVSEFELKRVSAKASVFDEQKLEWVNGHYLAEKDENLLLNPVSALWREWGWIQSEADQEKEYLLTVIRLLKVRSRRVTELAQKAEYFFNDPVDFDAKAARKHFKPESSGRLRRILDGIEELKEFNALTIEALFRELVETLGVSGGKLIHPTRLAVSGVSSGPGLFEILETLGRDVVKRRLSRALDMIPEPKHKPPDKGEISGEGDGA